MDFPKPAPIVFAMFSDASYLELKCAQSEHGTFTVTENGSMRNICIDRSFDDLPDAYRKFLGSDLIIKEEQIWNQNSDKSFHAKWKIVLDGKPIVLDGALILENSASGSLLTIDAQVTVSIPFFGAMAEGFISEHFANVIENERAIGLQWLEMHG